MPFVQAASRARVDVPHRDDVVERAARCTIRSASAGQPVEVQRLTRVSTFASSAFTRR